MVVEDVPFGVMRLSLDAPCQVCDFGNFSFSSHRQTGCIVHNLVVLL